MIIGRMKQASGFNKLKALEDAKKLINTNEDIRKEVPQIEPRPIQDSDKASGRGMPRKPSNGWAEKQTYALPDWRALGISEPVRLDQLADEICKPEKLTSQKRTADCSIQPYDN